MVIMSTYTLVDDGSDIPHYEFSFAGRDLKLIQHPGSILSVESLSIGSYEAPLPIILMAAISRTKGAFLDVGANIGIYSILATKTRNCLQVYAFEPLSEARELLTANLRINGTISQANISEVALSDNDGIATLHLPDPGHGLLETSASLEAGFKDVVNTIQVATRTLDSMKFSMPISVVKADIEGHEAAFLRGASRTLAADRPLVFAEMLSGASKNFFGVSKMMRDLEYICFRMRPDVVIYTEIVVADKGWNYAFIPREKVLLFQDCCRGHDIEMLRPY